MKFTPLVSYDHLICKEFTEAIYIPSFLWSLWLEQNRLFRYESPEGTCYVVKNESDRWIAELNIDGRVEKEDLGTSAELASKSPVELCNVVRKLKQNFIVGSLV